MLSTALTSSGHLSSVTDHYCTFSLNMIGEFSFSAFAVICSGPEYQEPNLPQGVKKKELINFNF